MKDRVLSLLSLITGIQFFGLALSALALTGFAKLADEVLENETLVFDRTVLLALRQLHTPLLDRVMVVVAAVGDPSLLLILTFMVSLGFGLRRRWPEGTVAVLAGGGAIALNYLLKQQFARSRPQLWERVVDVQFYSFPSGHAMVAFVVYGFLGYLLWEAWPRFRAQVVAGTLLLICAIGFSRLYLGVHWPTDVIAGYIAGFLWLVVCILTLRVWRRYLPSTV